MMSFSSLAWRSFFISLVMWRSLVISVLLSTDAGNDVAVYRISLRQGSNLLPASYCSDFVAKFNYSSNFSNVFHSGPQGADYWSLEEATPNASCLDCSAWNYTSCLDKKNAGLVTDSRAVTEQSDEMMFLSKGKKTIQKKRFKMRVNLRPWVWGQKLCLFPVLFCLSFHVL